jgi:hypothetical protein
MMPGTAARLPVAAHSFKVPDPASDGPMKPQGLQP